MINVLAPNLYIGSLHSLYKISPTAKQNWAFIHATHRTHYQMIGWEKEDGGPGEDHPHFIFCEKDNRLSLNWTEGGAYLYNLSGPETFIRTLDFIDKHIEKSKVLVHCSQGQSRAPTIALLYLAKRKRVVPYTSFAAAKREFVRLYPAYLPGSIGRYVSANWARIN